MSDILAKLKKPEASGAAARWFTVGVDRVRLLKDGVAAFPAMLAAIDAARAEILIEMYWFKTDRVGTIFRDRLAAAAARGVAVKLIYDAFGCLNVPQKFWARLTADSRAETLVFGPISPWKRRFEILHRNHRKLMVVDGTRAFVTGINIGDEWWPMDGKLGWRDDAIELAGPTAREIRALFWRSWGAAGGAVPFDVPRLPPEGNGLVWLIANERHFNNRREIRRTYLQQIRKARRSIDISNAYFLPDRQVIRALVAARRRGVPVRVIVPAVSDLYHVSLAQRAMLPRILAHGIEAYGYAAAILHAKTAVIDDFVTVGSYNLDYRSWRFNLESNLAVFDKDFASEARRNFEEDLHHSKKIEINDLQNHSWPERAYGWLLYQVHWML